MIGGASTVERLRATGQKWNCPLVLSKGKQTRQDGYLRLWKGHIAHKHRLKHEKHNHLKFVHSSEENLASLLHDFFRVNAKGTQETEKVKKRIELNFDSS